MQGDQDKGSGAQDALFKVRKGGKKGGLFQGADEDKKEESGDVVTPKEFLENTTIHGLTYFVRDDWGLVERGIWGIIVIGSFITAISFIYNSLQEPPTITTIRASTLPVQRTQFPTLTICPSDFADEDHLGFFRRYANHWKFDCFDGDCEDTEPTRDLVKFWTDSLFEKNFQRFLDGYYSGKRQTCFHSHESGNNCMNSFLQSMRGIRQLTDNSIYKETILGLIDRIKNNMGKYKNNDFIQSVLTPYVVSQRFKNTDIAEANTTGWKSEYSAISADSRVWTALVLGLYSPWETICTLRINMEQCLCNMPRGIGTFLTFSDRTPVYASVDLEEYTSKGQRGEHKLPMHIETDCVTSNATDPPHQPCIFPFFIEGRPVYQCQKFQNDAEAWCATSVDEERKPLTTGPCDPEICKPCKTVSGNVASEECRLPFFFKNDVFYMCTRQAYHRPWCSTLVSEPGFRHQGGHWGACDPDLCPSTANPGFFEDDTPDDLNTEVSPGLQRLNEHLTKVFTCMTNDSTNTLSFLDATLMLAKGVHETRWDWFYTIDGELKENAFGFWLRSPGVALDPTCNTTLMMHLGKRWFGHYMSRFKKAEIKEPNPCKPTFPGQVLSPCCGYYGRKLAKGLKTIMGMMRSIKPQGQRTESEERFVEQFKLDTCETLPRNKGFKGGVFERYQRLMINSCYFLQGISVRTENVTTDPGGFTVAERCGGFEPVLTSKGLCYAYNSASVPELYRPTPHRDAFMEAYDVKQEAKVVNVSSHGPDFLFKLVLDASVNGTHSRSRGKNHFLLALNNALSPFNVANNAIQIEVGYTTKLSIAPFQQVATDDLRDVRLKERNCRFKDENETMEIMKDYTLAGCQMECMMNMAEEECGCRPWDYPHPPGEVEEICDYYGQICFVQQMKDVEKLTNCDCVENCEIITYTYTMSREPISSSEEINCFREDKPELAQALMFRATTQRLSDYYNGLSIERSRDRGEDDYCNYCECAGLAECLQFVRQNIAMLEIQISTPTLVQTELAKRTSLANQIGVLGGNLGLFTGISVISLFEMLFWVRRIIFKPKESKSSPNKA